MRLKMKYLVLVISIMALFTTSSCVKKTMDLSNLNVIISDEIESPIDETIKEIISTKIENHSEKKIDFSDGVKEGSTLGSGVGVGD